MLSFLVTLFLVGFVAFGKNHSSTCLIFLLLIVPVTSLSLASIGMRPRRKT